MDLWLWGIWFVGVVVNSEELIVKDAKGFIHCSLFTVHFYNYVTAKKRRLLNE